MNSLITLAGGVVKSLNTAIDFIPDPEKIEALMSKKKAILLCSPAITGMVIPKLF